MLNLVVRNRLKNVDAASEAIGKIASDATSARDNTNLELAIKALEAIRRRIDGEIAFIEKLQKQGDGYVTIP